MKRIILVGLFFLLGALSFGEEGLSSVDTFSFSAREITTVNGKKRVKEYDVISRLPDDIKKTITAPEDNKGEIYIYTEGKKFVYLPLFEQSYEEKADTEENYIIKVIRDIKADKKLQEGISKGDLKKISYDDGITISFEEFTKIDGINFPKNIKVYDGKAQLSEVLLKNIKLNPPVDEKEFKF